MSWKSEVEEIERRRALARRHGGDEAVARQHARGRLTVRERIDAVLDSGTFAEVGGVAGHAEHDADGALARFTPAGVVVGTGRVDGRPCVVAGDDFTVGGGAYSVAGLRKGLFADEWAIRRRVPLVRLLEGGGASVRGVSGRQGRSGYDLVSDSPLNRLCVEALARVPVVCAALGAVAGYPAARLVASHFSIMTRDAQVLTGGPALVERALGEKATKEELGGHAVHLRSGVVDNLAADEADALRQIRRFLGYLPSSVYELPPRATCDDPRDRRDEALIDIVPRNRRRAYKVRDVISRVVDRDSFFEMTALFGRSQVTGLARLAGQPVAVLANDPIHDGGSMTAAGAQKVRRFVDFCGAFHLPVVSFVDEPGFMIGSAAERAGTIRHGMGAIFAVQQSPVPWAAVVLRRAFGVAAGIHLGNRATVFAWPSAEAGAMPVEAGVALAYGREIAAAPDPEARRRELEAEVAAAQSIFPRAEDFGVHDLIDPRETRPALCDWLDSVVHQRGERVAPRTWTLRP